MRRIAVYFAAALTLSGIAGAQQHPPQNPVARVVRASLAGITLTDAEKTKLESVRGVYAPKFKVAGEGMKPIRERMKAARQAKDTAAFRAARKDMIAQRKQSVAILQATLLDVRTALTAEHQAQFDKNIVRVRRMIRRRFAP